MLNKNLFDGKMEIINAEDVDKRGSTYGDDYFLTTETDIEALQNGNILFHLDEYGIFIKLDTPSHN